MKKTLVVFASATFFLMNVACICFAKNTIVALDPLRLEFNDGTNSSHVKILNSSKESRSYRVSTYSLRMQENGALMRPDRLTKREAIAKSMVHFSPRITTVPAGESQIVRVAVRRPPGLPAGDYFTYLNVSPIINANPEEMTNESDESFSINMNIGLSIPIIVTVGEYSPRVSLKSVRKAFSRKGEKIFIVELEREGPFNSYNAISVYGAIDGNEKLIAHHKRVVTYVPVREREVKIPLIEKEFSGDSIRVELKRLVGRDEVLIMSKTLTSSPP